MTDLESIIIGDELNYEKDQIPNSFLKIINELSNSMKHSMMHAEAYNQAGVNRPKIISFYAKNNNYEKVIIYQQHHSEQMMIVFQHTACRILRNQKIFKIE